MKAVLFLCLFSLSICRADVDLKSGNFFHSWIDAEISGQDFHFELSRVYNSRALHVGLFGKGFCSKIETQLSVLDDGNLSVQNCGAGQVTHYTKTGETWIFGDQVIEKNERVWVLKVGGVPTLQFNSSGRLEAFWLKNEKAKLTPDYNFPVQLFSIMSS